MAKHTQLQREFIVRKLAAFEPPRAIVAAFRAVFTDTACDENDILATDPKKNLVSPDLQALFLAERERVLLDPTSAPYADPIARVIAMSNDVDYLRGNNQLFDSHKVMRQIAEEQGIVGGKPGKKSDDGSGNSGAPMVPTSITWKIVRPEEVV